MMKFAQIIYLKSLILKSRLSQTTKSAYFSTENLKNKDSKWIYSSKYDEMQSMKKGKIYVTTDTGNDSHDVTLRMYNALLKESTVVFSHDPSKTKMLLKSLFNKDRWVDPSLHRQKQEDDQILSQQIIPRQNQASSLMKTSLQIQQQKSFQQTIETGKFVDMQIDMESVLKKSNDPSNKHFFQRQKELKKYLRNRQFRTQLQNIKNEQGHPQVLPLLSDTQGIKYFYQNGMDVTYVLHEFEIRKSNQILTALQQLGYPYQILPCKNELINAVVASGFPADRFSIEYFPQDLEQILLRRKKSKLTVAIVVESELLQRAIQTISVVFGKQHLVFVENSPLPFRSQIHNFLEYLKENPLKEEQYVKIIVSPFISEFNESLLQEQNKVRHIYGQAQSQKTNFMDLQLLGDKLQKLRKKQQTHQIDIFNMAAEMVNRLNNRDLTKKALQRMLSLSDKDAQNLVKQGQKRIKIDYLGLSQFQNIKRSK